MPTYNRFTPVVLILAALTATARQIRISDLPPPPWADTEAWLAVDMPVFDGSQSEFFFTLSLEATASNNLEVAFIEGNSEDGEPTVAIGWNCGEVFVRDKTRRGVSTFTPEDSRLTLSVVSRLSPQGEPTSTTMTANGSPVEFTDSEGEAFPFAYSMSWATAQVASRGAGAKNESLSIGFAADPTIIMIR